MTNAIELITLAAIWGASFLFMRLGAPEWGPVALITLRVSIAALMLFPTVNMVKACRSITRHALPFFIIGVTNSALPFCLFAYSTLYIGAGFSAILNATTPLGGALIAWLWFKTCLTRAQVIGLITGLTGIVMLVWEKLDTNKAANAWPAILAALTAALLYSFAANYSKRFLSGVAPRIVAFGSQFFASIALWPVALFMWPKQPVSMHAWYAVIALGILCTGIAYILYFRLLEHVGAPYAMSVTFLIPVFGTLWSVCFLGEKITLSMLVDSAIIFMGTMLASGKIRHPLWRRPPAG